MLPVGFEGLQRRSTLVFLGNRTTERFGGQPEILLLTCLDDDGHGSGEFDQFGIADPVGGRDDDFVARIQKDRKHIME